MKTIYVSDLDGTLLNHEQQISEETARVINVLIREGLHFTIATARSLESVLQIIKPLQLQLPFILTNGVFVFDPNIKDYIQCNFLDHLLGKEIIKYYEQNGISPLVYTMDHDRNVRVYYKGIFNQSENNYISNRINAGDNRFRRVTHYNHDSNEQIFAINAIDLPERLDFFYNAFNQNDKCICHYGPDIYTLGYHWLEITNRKANKGDAILFLKQFANADKIVCFGDNLNDLPMFEVADEKYVVSNGHELMLKAATKIIDSNLENGVANYLQSTFKQ